GVAIFPVVFSNELDPTEGAGLLFVTLPYALANMPMGALIGAMFFLLVLFAGLTSSISIGEPAVAWLVEKGNSRVKAATIIGALTWVLGVGSLLSFKIGRASCRERV